MIPSEPPALFPAASTDGFFPSNSPTLTWNFPKRIFAFVLLPVTKQPISPTNGARAGYSTPEKSATPLRQDLNHSRHRHDRRHGHHRNSPHAGGQGFPERISKQPRLPAGPTPIRPVD